jgi:UDP-N-acetylglucosamine 3-dehydrogenase
MLRIGVIGTGSMGKNHARVCSERDNIELVGIADTNKATAKEISTKFGTKPYDEYKDLLKNVDAAIIATPTATHFDIAMDFLNSGKHILVEKPICEKVEKAEKLVKKADDEKLVLAVGHIERHNPVVEFIKKSLTNKKYGDLITIASKRVSNLPTRIRDVGVVFDFGVHDIDVMRYLAGEVKSVYAKAGRFNKDIKYEDHANIVLNFENNICGIIEVNWLTPIKIRKLFLTCSKSYIEADYINQSITDSKVNKIELEKKEPLKREIEDFVNAIEKNKQPLASGYDGVMAIKIAEAATKSNRLRKEVNLEK